MTRNDRAALTLALEQSRTESPGRAEQLDPMLRDESWAKAATFAAFCCQTRSLNLDPWRSRRAALCACRALRPGCKEAAAADAGCSASADGIRPAGGHRSEEEKTLPKPGRVFG